MSPKVTIAEAGEFLECTPERVQELLRDGTLPGLKMGKAWVIPRGGFFTAVERLADEAAAAIREAGERAERERRAHAAAAEIKRGGRPRLARSS